MSHRDRYLKKNYLNIRTICHLFFITLLFAQSCGEEKRWSKEWEDGFEESQPSDKIMDSLQIKPGLVVAEIGAGNGRLAVKMARRVLPTGMVYANDIDKKAIDFMQERLKRDGISNMIVVEGEEDNPRLPEKTCDMICIVNTYHHFYKPVAILHNTLPALKENGKLVIIEAEPEKIRNRHDHATSKSKIISQADSAGFELQSVLTFLPKDEIYIFRSKLPRH